jgi:hypothetical protein
MWSMFDELRLGPEGRGDGYVLCEGCGESLEDRVKSVGTYFTDKSGSEVAIIARGCCIGRR